MFKGFPKFTQLLAIGLVLISCSEEEGVNNTNQKKQEFSQGICTNQDFNDGITVHIGYPKGNESFKVGQTIDINLCFEEDSLPSGFDGQKLWLYANNGVKEIYEFTKDISADTLNAIKNTGIFKWTIPDTIDIEYTPIAVKQKPEEFTNCRFVLTGYLNELSDRDSSGIFKIVP